MLMKSDCYTRKTVTTTAGAVAILVNFFISAVFAENRFPDTGMVMLLTGKAFYWHGNAKDKIALVKTFMKIRKDDHFRLSPHATVQLVYFSNGRTETWKGPGVFKVGETQSQAVDSQGVSPVPKVSSLPLVAADEIRRVSPLVDPSKLHRSGGGQIRGSDSENRSKPLPPVDLTDEEKKEIKAAKQIYRSLLAKEDQQDITPELYLFSFLADYDQFQEMRELIDQMRKKQPDNVGIQQLAEWLEKQEH